MPNLDNPLDTLKTRINFSSVNQLNVTNSHHPSTLNGLTVEKQINPFPLNFKTSVRTAVETITPEMAVIYLENNFSNNRNISWVKVKAYVEAMKRGEWELINDAICFDDKGKLINGQHRLAAVRESGIAVEFLVTRGLPRSSASKMDIGRKRTAAERLKIDGFNLSEKNHEQELACVRNALVPWETATTGPQFFRDAAELEHCGKFFEGHREFIIYICRVYKRLPGTYKAAALRIFAEMSSKKDFPFVHGMNAWNRSILWLELLDKGRAEGFRNSTDGAAIVLREYVNNLKQSKRFSLNSKEDLRRAMTMAHKFMIGKDTVSLGAAYKKDRFIALDELPFTNVDAPAF